MSAERPALGRLIAPLLASLTLGLAPFHPEPHVLGKVRWVLGGGTGMSAIDVLDLLMHGAPWLWLGGSLLTLAVSARRLRSSFRPGAVTETVAFFLAGEDRSSPSSPPTRGRAFAKAPKVAERRRPER